MLAGVGSKEKFTEQRIFENCDLAMALFDKSPSGILFADPKTMTFIEANKTICQWFNMSREQLLTKGVLDIHPKENLPFLTEAFQKMSRGEILNVYETPCLRSDKSIFYANIRGLTTEYKGKKIIVGFFEEITEKYLQDRYSREESRVFREIAEALDQNSLVSLTDKRGIIIRANERFCNISGYTVDELVGRPHSIVNSGFHPKEFWVDFWKTIKEGKVWKGEIKNKGKCGREYWVDTIINPITDEHNEITHFLSIRNDITDRKNFETELVKARVAADAANKAKSEFLANMSHEIRTPLNAVIGFTDLLKDVELEPQYKSYIQNANTSASLLLDLINDILDFSKIEAGKLELDEVSTDIFELLNHATDIVKYQASQKNIELLLNIVPETPRFIDIDAMRLRQVLVNLLSNAVKFTESGEVALELDFHELNSEKGSYTFTVRDTGIGMTDEQKSKLFKAFSQADVSITRRFGGTGLGLVICDGILEKMGSRFRVESHPGRGSTFSFTLKQKFTPGDAEPAEHLKNIGNILIVDDNQASIDILKAILTNWNQKVLIAHSVDEALEILNSKKVDVLITDLKMPNKDGLELIREIRKSESFKNLAIILLHSSARDDLIFRSKRDYNIAQILVKPVNTDSLLKALISLPRSKINFDIDNKTISIDPAENTTAGKIMIVEDVEMNMILIRTMLKKAFPNIEIVEAVNGLIALKRYMETLPDLILMDLHMPVLGGKETTRYLRELEKDLNREVPIIAVTAATSADEEQDCLDCGMVDFLPKPIKMKDLSSKIKKYLADS